MHHQRALAVLGEARADQLATNCLAEYMRERRRKREQEEYALYQSPANQLQRTLDWNWQLKLARDAERAYRRRAPDEHPERGEYSPIARFERENGRR
jgi:hypothetical protein